MSGTNPTESHILTSREWLESVKAGNRSLVDEFYLAEKDHFIGWSIDKYQLDREDAIDIYQNAILALYEGIVENKVSQLESSIKTYVYGIAKNLILKKFRKEKTAQNHQAKLAEHWESHYQTEENEVEVWREKVYQQMKVTGEPCRSILEQFYYHNYTLDQIAELLNYTSKDVVKTQKSRCLKTLRKELIGE